MMKSPERYYSETLSRASGLHFTTIFPLVTFCTRSKTKLNSNLNSNHRADIVFIFRDLSAEYTLV